MDNNNSQTTSSKNKNSKKAQTNCKHSSNKSQEKCSLGLERFSYADNVLLSSTLAYAISEELNDTDLALLLSFLGMLTSDLAMLITRSGIEKAKTDTQEAEIVDTIVPDISDEIIVADLGRKSKKTKVRKKYVRRKKK